MKVYREWAAGVKESDYSLIQYGKHIFQSNTNKEIVYEFCNKIPNIILKIENYKKGKGSLEENLLLKGPEYGENRFFKMRLSGSWRVVVLAEDNEEILTIVCVVDHDAQMERIKRWAKAHPKEKAKDNSYIEGYVRKSIDDFLRNAYALKSQKNKCTVKQFRTIFNSDINFNLDQEQRLAAETSTSNNVRNVIVVGNAGSGKSTVGVVWLEKQPEIQKKKLYLTMSRNLVKTYENNHKEQNILYKNMDMPLLPEIRYASIFDYMKEIAKSSDLFTSCKFLNPEASFREFKKVYKDLVDRRNPRLKKEDAFLYWREIHGLIKGAIKDREQLDDPNESIVDYLSEGDYIKIAAKHNSKLIGSNESVSNRLNIKDIKFVLQAYKKYLEENHYLDDNDLASILVKYKDEFTYDKVDMAFIDESQDLTEKQIYALMSVLSTCEQKLIASDRCQIIRPTFYNTGYMQQILENVTKSNKRPVVYYLNNNYRSSNSIKRLQNDLVLELSKHQKLKYEELNQVPLSKDEQNTEIVPIWIHDNEDNRKILMEILSDMEDGRLHRIYANSDKENELDVVGCKGISLPSVLLWRVFVDFARNVSEYDQMAWDAFYVGVTRAEKYLIILEPKDTLVGKFLEKTDTVVGCKDLKDYIDNRICDEMITWSQYILNILSGISFDEIIASAEEMFENEKYIQAEEIYRAHEKKDKKFKWLADCCHALYCTYECKYREALMYYGKLDRKIEDVRFSYVSEGLADILESGDVEPDDLLICKLMLLYDENYKNGYYANIDSLNEICDEYKQISGCNNDINCLIKSLCDEYPLIRSRIKSWMEDIAIMLDMKIEKFNESIAELYMEGNNHA